MSKWPLWLKVLLAVIGTGGVIAFAQVLLYLDKKVIFLGTFENFCASAEMTGIFGQASQHIICHQHDRSNT